MSFDPISAIADLVKTGVDKIFPDAGEKERNELTKFMATFQGQVQVMLAEMNGNWLQRSWRPILMLAIVAIVVNNYIVVPYLSCIWPDYIRVLELPDKLWNLLTLGVGGYVAGRSAEKIVGTLKGGSK